MPEQKKPKNVFEAVVEWFKHAADWVQENLGDPAIAETLRQDLGLAPGADIPPAEKGKFQQYAAGLDPDKVALDETITEITDVATDLVNLGETLKSGSMTGWDVAYLLGRIAATDSVRVRFPAIYAFAKLALFISDDPDSVEELDPALLVTILRGDPLPAGTSERLFQRVSAGLAFLVTIAETLLDKAAGPDLLDAYYGWDPAPDSPTPQADLVSSRAMTLLLGVPGHKIGQLSTTVLGVPREHGGPGLFLSFGGKLEIDQTIENTTYKFMAGATGAADLFIPFGGATRKFQGGGDPNGFLRIDVTRANGNQPAVRIGEPGKTRLEIGKLGWGLQLASDRAGFRFALQDGALIINLGEEGFLRQLQSGEVKVGFNFGLIADTNGGLRLDGGNRLRVTIPVGQSLLGVFTIHFIDLALGPGSPGRDLALELAGAFALTLGPFKGSVDRLGLLLDLAFKEGNLGVIDLKLGFKPPNGIGLALDAGMVKGGGYLFSDTARGEYAGALELKIGPVGVKAIGILSTRMPDGSPGWSLLLMIYGQFPPIQLSFGFTLTGIGGMIGLQHSVSLGALQTGMSSGVLDDLLFPQDPVADAPRLINRLRTVFPPTPRALIIGPFLELGWGTPNIVTLRLGVIIQMDNVLGGGDRPIAFSKIVLLGQLHVQLPMEVDGELVILKLLVDFLGYYDFDNMRLGFVARLRDSRLAGRLELTGMLVVRAEFGDQPTFVLAAGGFHPQFKDLPPGLPSPIDRLGVSFPIGLLKVQILGYFAVTPATVQAGAEVKISASLGPVDLSGHLGFDAICYLEPTFHFVVDLRAGVSIKFKGHTLAGVALSLTLEGPGRWRARGKATFTILFWDKDIDFDESWGQAPALPPVKTNVGQLLQQALADPGSWSAQLPVGGESLVTLGPVAGEQAVLAHPLGRLVVTQKVVPLGLAIQRYGNSQVAGANRFDIEPGNVKIGGRAVEPTVTNEFFARSQFLDLTEEQKLASPSFERFTAGVAVGTEAYQGASTVIPADIDYETAYLDPSQDIGRLVRTKLTGSTLSMAQLGWQSQQGAAAKSSLRTTQTLKPGEDRRIKVELPRVAVVDMEKMAAMAGVRLDGNAAFSLSLAAQAMAGVAESGQIVEMFEMA